MSARGLLMCLVLVGACGDDVPPDSQFSLTAAAVSYDEGVAKIKVTAERTGDLSRPLTVAVMSEDAGATESRDFAINSIFLAWGVEDDLPRTIEVMISDDQSIEPEESFRLWLRDGDVVSPKLTLTITDNDRVGEMLVLTDDGLYSFDADSPSVTRHRVAVKGLGSGEKVVDTDIRPRDGKLYAVSDAAKIYTIDMMTGSAAVMSTLSADPADASAPFTALAGTRYGVDFDPVVDRLRLVSDTGQNLRIDVDSGRTTTDAAIHGAATGLVAVGYAGNPTEACRTKLYGIDLASGQLMVQDPPNVGTTTAVGAGLGVTVTSALLDTVTTPAGVTTAFAMLTRPLESPAMYSVNLTSGEATRLQGSSGESGMRGFAIRPPVLTVPVEPCM